MADTSGLAADVAELDSLVGRCSRPRVRTLLQAALNDLKNQLEKQTQVKQAAAASSQPKENNDVKVSGTHKKLSNYAWDQSEKFVKIYVTLPPNTQLTDEQVQFDAADRSVSLTLSNVAGQSYSFVISGLCAPIVPAESKYKIKSTDVLLMLKKEKTGSEWPTITLIEKQLKDSKEKARKPAGDSDDPQAGLMNMMKQMYDEGDDEMKRNIRKTWYESQNGKKPGGGGGGGAMDMASMMAGMGGGAGGGGGGAMDMASMMGGMGGLGGAGGGKGGADMAKMMGQMGGLGGL